jgi:hypothetical protein
MLTAALNQYANVAATGTNIPFTVVQTQTGPLWHARVKICAGGLDGGTGAFTEASKRLFDLNMWHTHRLVY